MTGRRRPSGRPGGARGGGAAPPPPRPPPAAEALGLTPLARIVGMAGAATAPEWFTVAPIEALRRLFKKTGWSVDSVDLYEVNEAFSVVAMAAIQELGLDPERVNVNGGVVALGHPIGATGARLPGTLLYALADRGAARRGARPRLGGGGAGDGGGRAFNRKETLAPAGESPYKPKKRQPASPATGGTRSPRIRL